MTKILLGIAFATVFAVSMIFPNVLADDENEFLEIEKVKVKGQSVHIEVDDDVPVPPTGGDYGWAVPTSTGFIVITTHPNIGGDSAGQEPPPASDSIEDYHTHFLTAAGSENCGGPKATDASFEEVGLLMINGEKIWVTNIPADSSIGPTGDLQKKGAFGFTLEVRGGDLCIDIVGDDDDDDDDDDDYEDDDD